MRLWSLHPRYLDSRGLTAAWREALLARAVLAGQTRGYRAHPQLVRFAACACPSDAIDLYLKGLYAEALARGYRFDASKIRDVPSRRRLAVTSGQVAFELRHLRTKLRLRDPRRARQLPRAGDPVDLHPLFRGVPGSVEGWERTTGTRPSRS
ncbi:MAG TPA: pyrimidine dimer DNA glycosylase/endonuclease V [Rhodanobacteraceae bacterium]|jgi:hypothetical protein|nr:pyrimidine dimer DNA glycosylase/endonuclease V [Rhodanobacteraceae bacterium]